MTTRRAAQPDPLRPLHEMNPTGRFSDRVAEYRKFRPSYPAGAMDAILDGLGEAGTLLAADIGAGTGISSRLLADRGVRVAAIEPNAQMREGGRAEPNDRIRWLAGTAEATGLDAASVDIVLCAQAFHWFEPTAALREFRRILRARGRLALMWNCRDRSDPVTAGYSRAIADIGGESKLETKEFDAGVLGGSALFGPVQLVVVPNEQALDLAGLVGRAFSASYSPKAGPGREQLVAELTALHRTHADASGLVRLRYRTEVYLAEPAEGA